jgi:hypothetical protein
MPRRYGHHCMSTNLVHRLVGVYNSLMGQVEGIG